MIANLFFLLLTTRTQKTSVNAAIQDEWTNTILELRFCQSAVRFSNRKDLTTTAVAEVNTHIVPYKLKLLECGETCTNEMCGTINVYSDKRAPVAETVKFKLNDTNWFNKIIINLNLHALSTRQTYYAVLLHEFGHAIGLVHSGIDTIMSYVYNGQEVNYVHFTQDDVKNFYAGRTMPLLPLTLTEQRRRVCRL